MFPRCMLLAFPVNLCLNIDRPHVRTLKFGDKLTKVINLFSRLLLEISVIIAVVAGLSAGSAAFLLIVRLTEGYNLNYLTANAIMTLVVMPVVLAAAGGAYFACYAIGKAYRSLVGSHFETEA